MRRTTSPVFGSSPIRSITPIRSGFELCDLMSIKPIRCLLANSFGVGRWTLDVESSRERMTNDLTAEEVRALLKLEPHATCGFVRVTFISNQRIAPGGLPAPF